MSAIRSRWAAIGAAVAVSVGAGGLATAFAQSGEPPSSYNPLSPVRVLDTRDGTGTAGVVAPVGPDGTLNLDIDGVRVPAGATGVMMNVTVVDGTQPSWLAVYPKAGSRPLASNLNWYDAEAKPNLVAVPFGADGDITFYNFKGNVNVVADLVGYYSPNAYPVQLGAMSRFEDALNVVADGDNLAFSQLIGQVGGDVTYLPSDSFNLQAVGSYQVTYSFVVDGTSAAGTTHVELNTVRVGSERFFQSGSGGISHVSDSFVVTTTAPNSTLGVVASSTGTLRLGQASISIERIA